MLRTEEAFYCTVYLEKKTKKKKRKKKKRKKEEKKRRDREKSFENLPNFHRLYGNLSLVLLARRPEKVG